jgi:hypothetical protein
MISTIQSYEIIFLTFLGRTRDELVEATEARKMSSARSVELTILLNISAVFTHIIRNCSVQKNILMHVLITLVEHHVSGLSMPPIVQEGRRTGNRPGLNARVVLLTGTVEEDCLSNVEDFIGRMVTKRLIRLEKFV